MCQSEIKLRGSFSQNGILLLSSFFILFAIISPNSLNLEFKTIGQFGNAIFAHTHEIFDSGFDIFFFGDASDEVLVFLDTLEFTENLEFLQNRIFLVFLFG